jgi:hypothetical protein
MRGALEQFMVHLLVDATKGGSSGMLVDGVLYALAGLGLLGFAGWLRFGSGHRPEAGLGGVLVLASVTLAGALVLLAGLWLLLRSVGIGLA